MVVVAVAIFVAVGVGMGVDFHLTFHSSGDFGQFFQRCVRVFRCQPQLPDGKSDGCLLTSGRSLNFASIFAAQLAQSRFSM